MANIALKSSATGAANGTSWTDAYTTAVAALAADAAGDRLLASQTHSELSGAAITLTFAGTAANPSLAICADDSAWPPTAETTGAVIATTGANSHISIAGSVKMVGYELRAGTGGNQANITWSGDLGCAHFKNCLLNLNNSNAASRIGFGNSTMRGRVRLENTEIKFLSASQALNISNADVEFVGGGLAAGTTSPTFIFNSTAAYVANLRMTGFDASAGAAGMHLLNTTGNAGRAWLSNIKLPASWTGDLMASAPTSYGYRAEMYDSISGTARVLCRIHDYAGKISDDQVRVRSGGSSVYSIPYSLKFETTANASAATPLRGPATPNVPVAAGSAVTATVKLLIDDAAAWTAADAALFVQYRPTSGSPALMLTSTEISALTASPATLSSDADTWDTTGVTNVQKRALSVTFTPNESGFLHAWIEVYKPSATAYCDNKLTVA